MVLIKFRTMDKKLYEIEMAPETLIGEAKQIFQQQVGGCEVKSIRMIYKKKILNDTIAISTLDMNEKDFIVVCLPKSTTNQISQANQVVSKPATNAPAPNQANQPILQPIPAPVNQTNLNSLTTDPIPLYQPNQYNQSQLPQPLPTATLDLYNQISSISNLHNYGQANRPFRSTNAFNQIVQNTQSNGFPNDPEFYQKIDQLMEIGFFGRSECESALRASYGNVERAAEYLISGNIPSTPDIPNQNSPTIQLSNEFIITFRKMLQKEPRVLENFVEEFEIENPIFRQNPELLLSQFGLSTEGFDIEGIKNYSVSRVETSYFDQLLASVQKEVDCPNLKTCLDKIDPNYEENKRRRRIQQQEPAILNQFTNEEKEAIRRIQSLGNFNLNEVVQIYLSCDKNEEITANLLFESK